MRHYDLWLYDARRCMRVSAATGAVDFEVLNEFFQRVFDRASCGRSPVRRWQPTNEVGDASGHDDGDSTLGLLGTLMAGVSSGSSSLATADAV